MRVFILVIILFFGLTACNNDRKKSIETVEITDTVSVKATATSPNNNVKEPNGFKFVTDAEGDLNKDGIVDLVTVEQDTIGNKSTYKLQIYFGRNDKEWDLVLTSDSAIRARYPEVKNSVVNDAMFTGVAIKNGTLIISHELIRGSFSHQFRYQNKKFELIGYRSTGVSGGMIEETDFNLSTGDKIIKHMPIGGNKYIDETKTIERIKYLPNLATFEPYTYLLLN